MTRTSIRDGIKWDWDTALQLPYSCIVHKPDSAVSYFEGYKNIGRKYAIVKRYDQAYTVLKACLDVLPNGGSIFVKQGSYPLNGELVFDGGSHTTKEWGLEGEGIGTVIQQNLANKWAFIIKNSTKVTLKNLGIEVGSNAKGGILGDNTGASECSWQRGKIDNVVVAGGSAGNFLVHLINPIYCTIPYLRVMATAGNAMKIENISTTILYGNLKFGYLNVWVSAGDGLVLDGSTAPNTKNLNLCHFDHVTAVLGDTPAGTKGVTFGDRVKACSIDFLQVEGFEEALYVGGVSADTASNTFNGGILSATEKALHCGYYTIANKFKDFALSVPAGKTVVHEEQEFRDPNVHEDYFWEGDRTVTITTRVNNPPIFGGRCGNTKFFSRQWVATNVADGGTIPHGLVLTPNVALVVGSVAGEMVSVTGKDATNLTVAIKKHDGSAGTAQTVYCYAEI